MPSFLWAGPQQCCPTVLMTGLGCPGLSRAAGVDPRHARSPPTVCCLVWVGWVVPLQCQAERVTLCPWRGVHRLSPQRAGVPTSTLLSSAVPGKGVSSLLPGLTELTLGFLPFPTSGGSGDPPGPRPSVRQSHQPVLGVSLVPPERTLAGLEL